MTNLTPETLAELQRLLDATQRRLSSPRRAGKTYELDRLRDAAVRALPALLGAATELTHMTEARDNARAEVERLSAQVERVRELHERWPIHGDGDHPEDCDCGDPWVTVCRLCCTDGKDQHETCAVYHDHGPDKPICPTIAAIGGEQ